METAAAAERRPAGLGANGKAITFTTAPRAIAEKLEGGRGLFDRGPAPERRRQSFSGS
jgi:hypothetical protein